MTLVHDWPLFGLRIDASPLTLRVPDDGDLGALCQLALAGIHPPETMPFSVPWTDLASPQFERSFLQHHWRGRADFAQKTFDLHFVVMVDGEIVGLQSLHRRGSAPSEMQLRFETGSWLGLAHQRRGIGKVMRAAVVAFAFEYLRADVITSGAFVDNVASQRVSIAAGYELVRTDTILRRNVSAPHLFYELTRHRWERTRADDGIVVTGWDECRSMFAL